MIVFQLLIAHLLGDFVFQSNALLKRKYESWVGTLEHVLIVSFFTALLLFPYWNSWKAWAVVGIIFLIHFSQDVIKVEYDKRYNESKRSVLPFFVDQVLHIGLICLLGRQFMLTESLPLPQWMETLYFSDPLNVLIICLLLLTYTFDITLYQFKRHDNKKIQKYHPDYKSMVVRVIGFSVIYFAIFLVLGLDLLP